MDGPERSVGLPARSGLALPVALLGYTAFSNFFAAMFDLDQYGSDVTVYLWLAIVSTLLYLVKLGLDLFVGDSDVPTDPTDLDADLGDAAGFTLISVLSVLAFLMGAGWMGLAGRVSWGFGAVAAGLAAPAFGLAMMFFSAGLMYAVSRMVHMPRYNAKTVLGQTGRVYLTVPAKGAGRGQVEVVVSGRLKVMDAVSAGDEIPAFAPVTVASVRDDGVFVLAQSGSRSKASPRARRWGK